jgi:hypothetical protein
MINEKTQDNYLLPRGYSHKLTTLLLILTLLSTICTLYINYNMFLYMKNVLNAIEKPGSFLKNMLKPK